MPDKWKDNQAVWGEIYRGNTTSRVEELGFQGFTETRIEIVERPEETKHLNSIIKLSVEQNNVRKFAAKLRKLEVMRLIHTQG